MIDSLAPHISQAERLALCPVSPFVTIREDEESEETARLNAHPLSARNAGFVMPPARASYHIDGPTGGDASEGEGVESMEDADNAEEIETFAPYVLPSARNRGAVYAELRGMGVSMEG